MSVEYISTDMVKSTAWLAGFISTTYYEFGQITLFLSFLIYKTEIIMIPTSQDFVRI